MSEPDSRAPDGQAPAPSASAALPEDDVVAPPPAMPIQSTLYITPDGHVQFGALFAELVPLAKALDPSFNPTPAPPAPKDG
jgi:hypothetical protein